MPFWAYMLHCRGGSFYTGHTDDLDRRIAEHQSGLIAGYTSERLPVALVWSEEFPTRDEAKEAEKRIKGWSRAKKLALIRGDWDGISRLARSKDGPSTSSGRTDLEVDDDVLTHIQSHARTASPDECCGILLGTRAHITAAVPATNVHPTPQTRFEIDPQTLIDVHRAARTGGPQIAGYYHSHPHGPAHPSATDRAQAAHDGAIWAIVGDAGDITFWRDDEDRFTPLSYALTSG